MTNDDVYAIPGEDHILDTINPVTGLTSVYGKTEAQVKAESPLAVRMSWEDWRMAASKRQQTPIYWMRTTQHKYNEMLEVLPPIDWRSGAFLVGEPTDHDFGTGQPRYQAYRELGGFYYASSRPITRTELKKEL